MTEGETMPFKIDLTPSLMALEACEGLGIHVRTLEEAVRAYGDAVGEFGLTLWDVDRVMRVFEEAGRLERQRLAGRAKVRAALRQGRKRCVRDQDAGISWSADYYPYELWYGNEVDPPLRLRRLWWRNFRNLLARCREGQLLREYGPWGRLTQATRPPTQTDAFRMVLNSAHE